MARVVAIAAVLVLAASGCDIGPIRRVGPAPTPVRPAPTATGQVFDEERSVLPVDPGMSVVRVEFADRFTGYALAIGCGAAHTPSGGPAQPENMRCTAALGTTADGGRTWVPLEHPNPIGTNHQMYAIDPNTVVVFTEDGGYHLSADGGLHFVKVTEPLLTSKIGLFCQPPPCGVFEFQPLGPARKLPHQPGLPGDLSSVVVGSEGQVWAASNAAGRPYTAMSLDDGDTWQRHDVLVPDGARLWRVELKISADGDDAWLLGYRGEEPNDFPDWVWYHEPGGWALRDVGGHPPTGFVAPAGEQVLVAAGSDGMGVLDGGVANGSYQKRPFWPEQPDYITELADGTLVARSGDRLWLGPGEGAHRGWIEIIVTTP
jgi:hypothetical protein